MVEERRGETRGLMQALFEGTPASVCVSSHIPFNVCDGGGVLLQFDTLAQLAESPSVFFLHEVQPQLFRNTPAFLFFLCCLSVFFPAQLSTFPPSASSVCPRPPLSHSLFPPIPLCFKHSLTPPPSHAQCVSGSDSLPNLSAYNVSLSLFSLNPAVSFSHPPTGRESSSIR